MNKLALIVMLFSAGCVVHDDVRCPGPCGCDDDCATQQGACNTDADCGEGRPGGYGDAQSCNACDPGVDDGQCLAAACVNQECAYSSQPCTAATCTTTADCKLSGETCETNACDNPTGYTQGAYCDPGQSGAQTLCGVNLVCDPSTQQCEACQPVPCPQNSTWNASTCSCQPTACTTDSDCAISNVLCNDCPSGETRAGPCMDSACTAGACTLVINDCKAPVVCNAGALCQTCSADTDCAIGPCVSGHCTNTSECTTAADCTAPDQACTACDPRSMGANAAPQLA